MRCKFKHKDKPLLFFLGGCAFNCFIQWFSGVCPKDSISWTRQYEIAAEKLHRYNFILVLEKTKDPKYISAVETFFGVPGLKKKKASVCEPEADKANKKIPLVIKNETMANLRDLNNLDIILYEKITECLGDGSYNFPSWNPVRFYSNSSIRIPHQNFDKWTQDMREQQRKARQSDEESQGQL